ncbi:MAG: hypothetical protein AN484_07095 [Aphanizomenon flos-aquae WA102]|jgi:hypothetical protein|uniref:Uncharacterized protein n=1 Tax=Aphanizomenon flos-aquae WA102 TaxID=1710896 RepID=A0A1B7X564_APHFL|nr:MAG: hypothetical protein AN484_07095 [Aphanizomenon flos-aquae WA102]
MSKTRKKPRKGSTKATGRDYTYDKKYQKKKAKYRAELNAYNRAKGTYGNGDGLDASHKNGVISGFEPAAVNRARKTK